MVMMMMMMMMVMMMMMMLVLLLLVLVVVVVVMSGQAICFCEPANPQVKHSRIKIGPPPTSVRNKSQGFSGFQTLKDEDKRA